MMDTSHTDTHITHRHTHHTLPRSLPSCWWKITSGVWSLRSLLWQEHSGLFSVSCFCHHSNRKLSPQWLRRQVGWLVCAPSVWWWQEKIAPPSNSWRRRTSSGSALFPLLLSFSLNFLIDEPFHSFLLPSFTSVTHFYFQSITNPSSNSPLKASSSPRLFRMLFPDTFPHSSFASAPCWEFRFRRLWVTATLWPWHHTRLDFTIHRQQQLGNFLFLLLKVITISNRSPFSDM